MNRLQNKYLGNYIAMGGIAEDYDWQPGWVLKLYFERYESGLADTVTS